MIMLYLYVICNILSDAEFSCDLGDIPHHKSTLKAPNPIVAFSDLDIDDLEDLKDQMNALTREINAKFRTFRSRVFTSFRDENVDRDQVVLTLTDLDFEKDELDSTQTLFDVFMLINDHSSYFNYEVLEMVVKANGSGKDKTYLEDYKRAFSEYCKVYN